ncbi:type II secretion system F family protein [Paenibacillus albiflavus]|uniref:type II secretion system F family protein n=1 Tax=Paenibacillus albiflavus TaxID=2545760 RepID=UPI001404E7C7|nr:type II secretion system F family protein [Paenibacillus albiflavus]
MRIGIKSEQLRNKLIEYDLYDLSIRERLIVILIGGFVTGLVGFIFYKNLFLALLFGLTGLLFPRIWRSSVIKRRKDKLLIQFRQALYCLSSSLTAGKSIENAFRDALVDLKLLFIEPSNLIVQEFTIIVQRLDNGEQIERAVTDFSSRANIDDLTNFTDVLVTCKRTGGNLIEVMRRTTSILTEKIEIQTDIAVMLAQKKFESRIMTLAPICIVAILSFTSADYMQPLFQGVGRIIMTISLVVLGLCFWLTQRMMRIVV